MTDRKPGIPPGPWYIENWHPENWTGDSFTVQLGSQLAQGWRDGYYLCLSGMMNLETARLLAMVPELHDFVKWFAQSEFGKAEDESDREWHDRLSEDLSEQLASAEKILAMIREGRP